MAEELFDRSADIQKELGQTINTGNDLIQRNVDVPEYMPPSLSGFDRESAFRALESKGTDAFQTAVDLDAGKLPWALETFRGVSPEVATQVDKIARGQQLDFIDVLNNKDAWEKQQEAKRVYQSLFDKDEKGQYKTPRVAQWITDPRNAAMAKHDVNSLADIENIVRMNTKTPLRSEASNAFLSGLSSFDLALARAPALAYSFMTLPYNIGAKITGAPYAEIPKELYDNAITRYYENSAKRFQPAVMSADTTELLKAGQYGEASKKLLLSAIQSAPVTLSVLATSGLTGSLTAAAGLAGGIRASDVIVNNQGKKDPVLSAIDATGQGAAEVLYESLGTLSIFSAGAKEVIKTFGKAPGLEFIKSGVKHLAESFGIEGTEEFFTSLTQDLFDYSTGNKDAMTGAGARAVEAFAVGGISGIGLSGPSAILNSVNQLNQSRDAHQNFDQLKLAAQESKLRKAHPELFNELLEDVMTDAGANGNVYIPAEAVNAFLQSAPEDGAKLVKDLGIEQQLSDSQKTGADIEIKKAQWISKYAGTPIDERFKKEIKLSLSDMSQAQQENFATKVRQDLDQLQVEYDRMLAENALPVEAEEIRATMIRPREEGGMGLKADEANTNMAILTSSLKYFARERGETLAESFKRVNPTLQVMQEARVTPEAFTQAPKSTDKKYLKAVQKLSLPKEYESGAVQDVIDTVLGGMESGLLHVEAGYRQGIEQAKSMQEKYVSVPSTFPQWYTDIGFTSKADALSKIKNKNPQVVSAVLSMLQSGVEVPGLVSKEEQANFYRAIGDKTNLAKLNEERIKEIEDKMLRAQTAGDVQEYEALKKLIEENKAKDQQEPFTLFQSVWHGSPHDFGQFNLQAIGTGEGQQAYGWGLYFSSDKEVAEWYRDKLVTTSKGRLYKVDIPESQDMLQWELSIAEQNDKVKTFFNEQIRASQEVELKKLKGGWTLVRKSNGLPASIYQGRVNDADTATYHKTKTAAAKWFKDELKHDPYNTLTGRGLYEILEADLKSPELASKKLLENNIPGLMYFTGQSRNSTKDEFNFVVFDDSLVKIEQKFYQGPRGSVEFFDNNAAIKLFQAADLSTFVHENGHIIVNEMQKLIDTGKASAQAKADYDILLKYADGKFDREGHEKVATAFEAYLREGKAPSIQLQGAFQRLRAWLTAIYKSIKDVGVELTPEIRGVFDRILASEQEIALAQKYYSGRKSLADALGIEENQDIKATREEAKQAALDKQISKHLKAYLKAIGGRQVIVEHATREIESKEVYKAIQMATDNKGIDLENAKVVIGDAVVAQINAEHPGLIVENGGETLSSLAGNFDFPSEYALADAIANSMSKGKAINTRVEEIIKTHEFTIREELSKQEAIEGEDAVHNDKSLEILLAEAQMLQDKLKATGRPVDQVRALEAKVMKDEAIAHLRKMNVRKAQRIDLFGKAEVKAANEAIDFAEKGDIVKSHEAKRRQIYNHLLIQESVKIREEMSKIERRYQSSNIKKKIKKVEDELAQYALDVIKTYNLSTSPSVAPTRTPKDLKDIDPILAGLVPAWIQQRAMPNNAEKWQDLSVNQVTELDDALQAIIKYGRNELSTIEEENLKSIDDFVKASTDKMSELEDKQIYDEFSKKGKVAHAIDGIMSQLVQMEFLAERLDNFNMQRTGEFGPMRRLFRASVKSEDKYRTLREKAYNDAVPHWQTLYSAKKRLEKEFGGKTFPIVGVPVTAEMQREGRFGWTADRLIAFVLNMGNEGNMQALRNSYQYNEAQMQRIASFLTKEELNAIQGIWDVTDSMFPELNKVHYNMYNSHLAKVEAAPIKIAVQSGEVVELKGGYYPLQFDHLLSDQVENYSEIKDAKEADIMQNRQNAVFRKTKPEDGMTYSRTPGHALPPKLDLDVWFSHIADTTRYIAYAEYMRDVNRVVINKDFRASVRAKAGRETYKAIRDWVNYLAVPERRNQGDVWSRFIDYQRKMGSIAILGLNFTTGIKQRLAVFNVAQEIGWKWLYEGVKATDAATSILGLDKTQSWNKILELSPYLRSRQGNIDREMSDTLNRMSPHVKRFEIAGRSFSMADVQDFMFEWLTMNDRAIIAVSWQGAFSKYMDENMSNPDMTDKQRVADAVAKADAVISTTQPSSLPIDMNVIQRSEGAVRLFTSFMTGTMKYGNRVLSKYQAYQAGAMTRREYYRHMLYETVFFGWGDCLIGGIMFAGAPPELWEFALAPLETLLSWIPFARDVFGAVKYKKSVGKTPVVEGVDRTIKAVNSAWQAGAGDKEWSDALFDMGRAVEFQIGVPALRMYKDAKHNYNLITGEQTRR